MTPSNESHLQTHEPDAAQLALTEKEQRVLLERLAPKVSDLRAFLNYLACDPAIVERLRGVQNLCYAAVPADPWADWVIDSLIRDVQASAERVPVSMSKMLEIYNSSTASVTVAGWLESQGKLAAEVPDYFAVVGRVHTLIPSHLGIAIAESAHGPRLAYYLALNPVELDRVLRLSPHSCVRELGKLEAMLLRGRAADSLADWEPERPHS